MIKKTFSIVTLLCILVGCNAQKSAKNIEENEVTKTNQETVDTFRRHITENILHQTWIC